MSVSLLCSSALLSGQFHCPRFPSSVGTCLVVVVAELVLAVDISVVVVSGYMCVVVVSYLMCSGVVGIPVDSTAEKVTVGRWVSVGSAAELSHHHPPPPPPPVE